MTLSELARWHARQAKATTGADRDFHTKPPSSCVTSPNVEPNIATTSPQHLPSGKPRASVWADHEPIPQSRKPSGHRSGPAGRASVR
jgi:hypothetical protein